VAEDIVAREVLVDFLYQGHLQYHLYGSVSAYDRADAMIRDLAAEGVAVVAAAEIERLRAEVARFQENSAARAEREADYRRVITELEDEIAKRRGERLEFANEPIYGPWTIEEVEQLAASLHSEPCPLKRKAIRFTVRHLPNRDDWEWANRTAEYLGLGDDKAAIQMSDEK